MSQWEKVYGVDAVEALLRHHPKRVKQLWLAEVCQDPRVQALVGAGRSGARAGGHA
ncbi:MAG: RNA methyltransferase substrate-binding domain-containing protein [Pseudomonas sp.]